MDHQEHHEMLLAITHPSGAEEWYCPTCGRRFLLKWPPTYQKLVIEPGDEYAAHSGSKGDMLHMGTADLLGASDRSGAGELPADLSQPLSTANDMLFPQAADHLSEADEIGDVPITDELLPWLRWLNGAGLDDQPEESA